jgi:hypothetical protein
MGNLLLTSSDADSKQASSCCLSVQVRGGLVLLPRALQWSLHDAVAVCSIRCKSQTLCMVNITLVHT